MAEVVKTTILLRRGKEEAWYRNNPILANGEPAFTIDKNGLKIGNGVDHWRDLEYVGGGEVVVEGLETTVEEIVNILGDSETEGTVIYRTEQLELRVELLNEAIANSEEIEISNIGTEEEPKMALAIKEVNVNKLVQDENDFLVLYGGSASDNI